MNRLGDYKLRRRLAVGGMGEVYLGEKIGPEGFVKPVVLKCVLPQLSRDPAFVQLFLDEARTLEKAVEEIKGSRRLVHGDHVACSFDRQESHAGVGTVAERT